MPQAIAMQLPVTAAATPPAAMALASTGNVPGKTPLFAGVLLRLGRVHRSRRCLPANQRLPGRPTRQ